jgi:chromosome segregation ATPase
MFKKLLIVGVTAILGVMALQGSRLGSFLLSEARTLRERAEAAIPPEREIARLRYELRQLDKDIYEVVNKLAKENVQTAQLEERVKQLRESQARQRELLEARAEVIKKAQDTVAFDNRRLTVPQAKQLLEEGVQRYTLQEKTLASLEQALATRQRIRETLRQQLEAMKTQKAELAAKIDALEADLMVLKLQQIESKYQTDDSRLAQIKESIRNLQMQIDVEREKLHLLPTALEGAPSRTAEKSVDDIMAPLRTDAAASSN